MYKFFHKIIKKTSISYIERTLPLVLYIEMNEREELRASLHSIFSEHRNHMKKKFKQKCNNSNNNNDFKYYFFFFFLFLYTCHLRMIVVCLFCIYKWFRFAFVKEIFDFEIIFFLCVVRSFDWSVDGLFYPSKQSFHEIHKD